LTHIRTFFWTFRVLLGFWRRNRLSFITLIVGLGVATALWSGVQAINAEARSSYRSAAATLGGDQFRALLPLAGTSVSQELFVTLRRAGWRVSPVVEGTVRINGSHIRLIGIEPISLPDAEDSQNRWLMAFADSNADLEAFLTPPFKAFAHPATLASLVPDQAGSVAIDKGGELPPLAALENLPPGTIMTDIGVAQRLLGLQGRISRLIVDDRQKADEKTLGALIEGQLRLEQPAASSALESLTDSFHLNLTAFGFLSFVVGLFIVNSAVGLAFESRRHMVRTLRACGVSARLLALALMLELALLSFLAGALGVVAGYLIASALLPDVSASLEGLYGAQVSGQLTLQWQWWLSGLAIAMLGAFFAAGASLAKLVRMPILANAHPFAWRQVNQRKRKWQLAVAAGFALTGLAAFAIGGSLIAGFVLMGAVLLSAALVLPSVLAAILAGFEARARRPLRQWFWADSNQHMSGLSLALMALLLALSINIGVGTMVQSFRTTFLAWLDQRLTSEIYLNAGTPQQSDAVLAYLADAPGVTAILPIWNIETRYKDWPVEVFGFRDHPTYRDNWPLLAQTKAVWQDIAAGKGVLINEQMARKFGLGLNDELQLVSESGPLTTQVLGIFSDYGNPIGQVMMAVDRLVALWPSVPKTRFGLRVAAPDKARILTELDQRFEFREGALIDQEALKNVSKSVFERTFAVTLALNALTLAVAGIAMLTSLLGLSQARLPQLAPIWALGITRRNLALIELAKTVALALLTSLLAIPLGLLVAWILLAIINVEAFGWRLPMLLFPLDWLRLLALSVITALLASAYPAVKLRRMPPAELLKVFANER
tara:strand:+ start:267 stop:2759 length:2493 start_codon:yes stop_codon:yes gene_type:complete